MSKRGRFIPLSVKLVSCTVLVLGLASALVIYELSNHERTQLVSAKAAAAERTANLFAAYDAVSLAFGDDQGVLDDVATLGSSAEVTYAAVWSLSRADPIAVVSRGEQRPHKPEIREKTEISDTHVDVVRPIRVPDGEVLGVALVRMSLARENQAFIAARQRIVQLTALMAAVIAVLIMLVVRWTVVRPLGVLARAAEGLQRGTRERVGLKANDEVGLLSQAFDTMTEAIVDRETKLVATSGRLQNVLDHMGQAIVVVGADGKIEHERSRQAQEFVQDTQACPSIVDVLFPESSSTFVERDAFQAWLNEVQGNPLARWNELQELAPPETSIERNGDRVIYELGFNPLLEDGKVQRLMVLATDVSSQRALLQKVARQDEEHARRLAAMRRLVAGGGQVFVRFLSAARYRVGVCQELVQKIENEAADSLTREQAAEELFRHVHTLRGEVRCFDLDLVEEGLVAIEFGLADLRTRRDERYDVKRACADMGQRLVRTSEGLDEAERMFVAQSPVGEAILDQVTVRRSDVQRLTALAEQAGGELRELSQRLSSRPFGEIVFFVAEAVPRWLGREEKKAVLAVEGRTTNVPGSLANVLSGVLSHLVRNAIAHGIESPDERQAAGKPLQATLVLECREDARGVCIDVRDDGAGFDLARLKQSAATHGVVAGADAVELAFVQGISSREQANDSAGHGVGLAAVRSELRAVGYDIVITSRPGEGTCATLVPSTKALEVAS